MIDDRQLDTRLRAMASSVEWPADVDVAPAVAAEVERSSQRRPRRWLAAPAWRPALAAFAVALLAFTAVLAFSPAARTAVARLLGFPGVAVEVTTEPAPERSDLDLGDELTVREAQERAGWELGTLPLRVDRVSLDEKTGAVHI